MKRGNRLWNMCLVTSILAIPVLASEKTMNTETEYNVVVQVDFANSSKYRDINLDSMGSRKGRQIVLNKIRDVFRSEAQKFMPSGYALEVQVLDIDLAGEYEPERFPNDNVRIDKEIYPPRIRFDYRIYDDSGSLIGEGSERLSDLGYLQNSVRPLRSNSEIAYDVSTLIRDWMKGKLNRKMKEIASWEN